MERIKHNEEVTNLAIKVYKPKLRVDYYAKSYDIMRSVSEMWKCPRCGRELKNVDQNHFCTKPKSIDEYIDSQREDVRPLLQSIRRTIRAAAPEAIEKISWQMPTFWQGENLIHFAAFKKHIGLYPGGEATTEFAGRLAGFKTSKGAIQLPIDKSIDHELITDIVKWRVRQVEGAKWRNSQPKS